MQRTAHTKDSKSAGPLADAGTYTYDLPVTYGVGQLSHMPRPVQKSTRSAWVTSGILVLLNFSSQWLHGWSGWGLLHCYLLLYGAASILSYWTKAKPRPKFLPWTLKVVGIWLNCYIGLVTVPESLRSLLPEPLAFGLPAFFVTLALYSVMPVKPDTGKKWSLWQWLLWAMAAAAYWGSFGPSLVK
jgi:hypothetical protein